MFHIWLHRLNTTRFGCGMKGLSRGVMGKPLPALQAVQ
jgi:hypothetical protein